jgi:hypothetical protein
MTKNNKLTRPFAGPQYRAQIAVGPIPTNFSWNFNPDNNEWEIVKGMPEGTDDVVVFSSPSKADAGSAVRDAIEKEFPGLLAQHGGTFS